MRLSLRNMIISFALSLIVFSLIMTVVCISIYRSMIDVRTDTEGSAVAFALVSRNSKYEFSDARLYFETDADNNIRFLSIIGVSEAKKTVTVTSVSATHPIHYKDGIYYVSSVWHEQGQDMLIPLSEALTGLSPQDIASVSSNANDLNGFYEYVKQLASSRYAGYTVERVDVVSDGDGVVDNEKTVEQFFTSKTK